jgi:hypothetical protein
MAIESWRPRGGGGRGCRRTQHSASLGSGLLYCFRTSNLRARNTLLFATHCVLAVYQFSRLLHIPSRCRRCTRSIESSRRDRHPGLNVAKANGQWNHRACTYSFPASFISITYICIICSETIAADPVETKNVYIEVGLCTISWDSKQRHHPQAPAPRRLLHEHLAPLRRRRQHARPRCRQASRRRSGQQHGPLPRCPLEQRL